MFDKIKIDKREPCPCDSGGNYGECCLNKPIRKFRSDSEKLALINAQFRKSKIKTCLYKDCKARAKEIVSAHAMQENKILSKLCVNDKIYMQNTKDNPTILEIEKSKPEPFYFLDLVHKNTATAYTCFCGKHDNDVFAKIEKPMYEFNPNDQQQLFLFAYKTFSFEYYKEIVVSRFYRNMAREMPELLKIPFVVYNYRQSILKKQEMDYYKNFFDDSFEVEDYRGIKSVVIELPYEVQFANYMCVAPPFDIKGRKIKLIDRKSKMMRRVFFTIFPDNNKSYVLITILNKDLNIYDFYLRELKEASIGLIKYYLNIFIPLYSENLILSPRLWDEWNEEGQAAIQFLVTNSNPGFYLKCLRLYLKNLSKQKDINTDTNHLKFNLFLE